MNKFDDYCASNNIYQLKKLLFPPPQAKIQRGYMKQKIDIHQGNEIGFIQACSHNHLEMVKFLTTLYKTNKYKNDRIDINIKIVDGFYYNKKTLNMFADACEKGYINIVIYLSLLYKTDGYPPIDIHIGSEHAFRSACANNHLTVVKYIISLWKKHKVWCVQPSLSATQVYKPINIYMNTYKRDRFSYYDFIYKCNNRTLKYILNLGLFNNKTKTIILL